MSDDPNTPGDPPDGDAMLAAEYVLGLLPASEADAFALRLETEGALRAEVARWQEDFVALADDIAPAAPPARVRRALAEATAPAPSRRSRGLGPRLRFLGGLGSGIAVAALAALVAVLLVPQAAPPPETPSDTAGTEADAPSYAARIAADDDSLVMQASYQADSGALSVSRSAGGAPQGRVLELWLIPNGADAPVSLGVLPEEDSAELAVPEPLRDRIAGGTLAVSEEPPGGSPTGAPTGQVLAAGAVSEG
ncbi:Anti-sigma-K factor RskA [Tranquillimonas rosea]|uniref:Anti-sigma-K factor RskA n=1 Tax=Tranquillimonas rosea TaxID=641238 RepID=A0A1H9V0Y9_9RHOB|nr:anti-sigma factor [Tranquillimonas rosea]SES15231.1 Anti-sigma-K factor RskA [Tranquillimonas rosea]